MKKYENTKDQDVKILGNHLEGKDIAFLVTGGIAAYKTPSIVRHFRQYGGKKGVNLVVYLTPEAKRFVTEDALEWASTNKVISELSPKSEHLYNYDAYVVAPATYNTIGKIINGIADNAVTTVIASAIGRLENNETSILLAYSMHSTLENSILKENIKQLKSKGIKIIEPDYGLGKANLPKSHYIVVPTIRELSDDLLNGKNILVTAGPTPGRIDNVRMITNRFRGRLGIMIADEAYMRGSNVKLILGPSGIQAPKYLDTIIIIDFDQYHSEVIKSLKENSFDAGIFSAAVADYIPKKTLEGKMPSHGALKSIPLKETPKVIRDVKETHPNLFMVTFKYEDGVSKKELEKIAENRVKEGYEIVVANRREDIDVKSGKHKAIIVDESSIIARPSTPGEIVNSLLDVLGKRV